MFSKAQLRSIFTKYLSVLENSLVKFSMVILSYFQLLIIFALLDVIFTFPLGRQLFFFIGVLISLSKPLAVGGRLFKSKYNSYS